MRRRAFPGSGPEVEARYQRAGQWLLATMYRDDKAASWCKVNGVPIAKAAGESIGSAGAFLVPAELSAAILDLRDSYGAMRRRARIVPMSSDSASVRRHTGGGATVSFIGENNAASADALTLDTISLTAKKVGALVQISSELEEDASIDVVDYIANEIAFAFAVQEDACGFNGDGTSAYGRMRGITQLVLDGNHGKAKVTAASGNNTYTLINSTDIGNLVSAVRASAIPNAAWYCSQTCFSQTFIRLAGGTGYLPAQELDGVMTPYYLGFPVILTQKLPLASTSLSGQAMLVFGDMYAGAVFGQRRGITLARSADRYLDQDEIGILATERFHINVHDMGDNTNAGSLAALVAP